MAPDLAYLAVFLHHPTAAPVFLSQHPQNFEYRILVWALSISQSPKMHFYHEAYQKNKTTEPNRSSIDSLFVGL
jgi:hypothetical protein